MLGGGAPGAPRGSAPPGQAAQPAVQVLDDTLPELDDLPPDLAAHWRSVIM